MENTNNILASLLVAAQVPLNRKEYCINESTLMDLGLVDHLAYTYHKGLEVICIEERTRYEWKEVEDGEEGLLLFNFIYPNGLVVDGVDYSNKEYNFIKIKKPGLQDVILTNNLITQPLLVNITDQKSLTFYTSNGTLLALGNSDALEPYFGRVFVGLGDSFSQPYVGLQFFDNSTKFLDLKNNKGIEYAADYSSNFTALSLVNKQWVLNQIITPDGSETKINPGTGISRTGTGTNADPYVISSTITQADGSETKLSNGTNINITGNGTFGNPYVINNTYVADGSETKLVNGTNTTITGNGTTGTPYQVNVSLTNLYNNKGTILCDINDNVTVNYPVTGDIVSATKTADLGSGEEITVVLANAFADLNYEVNINVESLGNMQDDNEIHPVIWQKISSSSFKIYLEETGAPQVQNLRLLIKTNVF